MELLGGRDLFLTCFFVLNICGKGIFWIGFFWGEGLGSPSSMGKKCPFCLRQLDFLVLGV